MFIVPCQSLNCIFMQKNGEKYAESTVIGKRRKEGAKCQFLGRFAIQFLLSNVKIGLRLSKRLFEAVK